MHVQIVTGRRVPFYYYSQKLSTHAWLRTSILNNLEIKNSFNTPPQKYTLVSHAFYLLHLTFEP